MPALSTLEFVLDAALPALDSSLSFANLRNLTLNCDSLHSVSQLLYQCQFYAITIFTLSIDRRPSRQELSFFLSGILKCGVGQIIKSLSLVHGEQSPSLGEDGALQLGMEDLRPCMAFSNLDTLDLYIGWNVDLRDSELLLLASSWPCLKFLSINGDFGWNTQGGITPNGLLQLFQICPSLHSIYVVVDTRGYIELLSCGLLANQTSSHIYIDVLDSKIEAESMPAIAALFARTPYSSISLKCCYWFDDIPGWEIYRFRWYDVRELMESPGFKPSLLPNP